MQEKEKLIELKDLQITFGTGKKKFVAVDHVNFDIYKGETFALVGESGSGKTTIGRAITRINPVSAGEILFKGRRISGKISKELDLEVIKKCQMIFQDPYASLNPRMTVADIVGEPLDIHHICSGKAREEYILDLLSRVGLNKDHASRYPHEFSGGMKQRVVIAMALACNPEFIICDEPISALDVSIQAQVINMLEDLQEQMGLTYLFVAHDLSMVRHISDRVGVMYLGSLVEIAETEELYNHNQHPYTKALLSAIPVADPDLSRQSRQILLEGDVPSPLNSPVGCKFASRCPHAKDVCRELAPVLKETHKGHFVACHLVEGQ